MNLMGTGTPMQTARSQVARMAAQTDPVMPSHTTSDQYESQGDVPDDATTLGMTAALKN